MENNNNNNNNDNVLPFKRRARARRARSRRGNKQGVQCDVCERPLDAAKITVEIHTEVSTVRLHMHRQCHVIWQTVGKVIAIEKLSVEQASRADEDTE